MKNSNSTIQHSPSTKRALAIADRRRIARGAEASDCIDVLVGIFRSHPDSSEPFYLLNHAGIPAAEFDNRIAAIDGGFGAFGNLRPGSLGEPQSSSVSLDTPAGYDREANEVLDMANQLALEFSSSDSVGMRLRDLFGGILLVDNRAATLLSEALSVSFLSLDDVRESYRVFLEWKQQPETYSEFLAHRHPPPRFPVSGFSADTISDTDFVGIGPEVNAMAYLISARTLVPPLAIGLFGDWGSGKSFFMRALRGRINTITDHARHSGLPQKEIDLYKYVVQIEFNAWHYVEGQLWASLVEHILRNLQTDQEEDESELQIRKNHWLKRLRTARDEDESIRALKTSLIKALEDTQQRVEQAQHELEQKRQELETYTAQGVWQVMNVEGEVKAKAKELFDAGGLGTVPESAEKLSSAIEESRVLWERGNALLAPLRADGAPRKAWLLGVIAVAAVGPAVSYSLDQIVISDITRALCSLGSIMGAVGAAIAAANGWVSGLLSKAEAAANALEAAKTKSQKTYVDRVEALRGAQTEVADQLAKVEQDAHEKRLEIEELQRELDGLTPGRLLLDFINERVGSDDYRQHLGVAALIRRDFEKLSDLIRSSNEKFVETDSGEITPDDQHRINRIVLYIDDLDRCPPERVVEVLQAVHLLMAFPLFVVVVAVDSRWLSQSLQSHYEKLLSQDSDDALSNQQATADDYLEKIFQIPFWVRPLGEGARIRIVEGLVAGSLAVDANAESDSTDSPAVSAAGPDLVQWEPDGRAQPLRVNAATDLTPSSLEITSEEVSCMGAIRGLLGDSPRSVKRFVNVYRLIKAGESGHLNRFVVEGDDAGYRIVLFLLAIVTGLPAAATAIFSALPKEQADTLGMLVAGLINGEALDQHTRAELHLLNAWLTDPDNLSWANLTPSQILNWSDQVRRYTYRHHLRD